MITSLINTNLEYKEINIEVDIAGRKISVSGPSSSYNLVNEAAENVNFRIEKLKEQYKAENIQDILAMSLLMLEMENIEKFEQLERSGELLEKLDQKLSVYYKK